MTEEQKKEYFKKVDDHIKEYGYHSTFVFDKTLPSFCYSTGIFRNFNIPEIFISSLPENLSFEIVHNYVKYFKGTSDIPLNTKIDNLIDRFPVILIEAPISKLTEYVLTSFRFYKKDAFKYLQLVYPDPQGHFPNDKGYDYDQVIMGELTY